MNSWFANDKHHLVTRMQQQQYELEFKEKQRDFVEQQMVKLSFQKQIKTGALNNQKQTVIERTIRFVADADFELCCCHLRLFIEQSWRQRLLQLDDEIESLYLAMKTEQAQNPQLVLQPLLLARSLSAN